MQILIAVTSQLLLVFKRPLSPARLLPTRLPELQRAEADARAFRRGM